MGLKTRYSYTKPTVPAELLRDPEFSDLEPEVLGILWKRGYQTKEQLHDLLAEDPNLLLQDMSMKGLARASQIIARAVLKRVKIVVYRDYDCDGCVAGAVVLECLRGLGADVEQYANERGGDGYGMCVNGVKNILAKYPDTKLIITVDNGITALEPVQFAREQNLAVVVTDHHEQGEVLPQAQAVVDPKRNDEVCDFRYFCGAGVAFKLMADVYRTLGMDPGPVLKTLDLVALATVADVVPLTGENRVIVRDGLKRINRGDRPFFQVLKTLTKMDKVNASRGLGYVFGPMVNAASRLDLDTNEVVNMMLSRDIPALEVQVRRLMDLNEERKTMTTARTEDLMTRVEGMEDRLTRTCFLLRDDSAIEGIIGLLAGRVKEAWNRPTIVFTLNDRGILKGSARSIQELHIKQALDRVPEGILLTHGGHAKAAGLSLAPENFEAFASAFTAICDDALKGMDFHPVLELDYVLDEPDLTVRLANALERLEPFGEGFPPLHFGLRADPIRIQYMGAEQQHSKYITASGLQIIRWNKADVDRKKTSMPVKFIGVPSLNEWNGNVSVQFVCDRDWD